MRLMRNRTSSPGGDAEAAAGARPGQQVAHAWRPDWHVDHGRILEDVGAHVPRARGTDPYPEIHALQPERKREPDKGVFGGAVGSVAWVREESASRCGVDNVPEPLPGHDRVGGKRAA